MSGADQAAADPGVAVAGSLETQQDRQVRRQPPYQVILHDDDDHTYDYVIGMLRRLFGHALEQAYELAVVVDTAGLAVVDTTTFERAEFKRDQIHAYGRDWRLDRSAGSMSCTIEPASG